MADKNKMTNEQVKQMIYDLMHGETAPEEFEALYSVDNEFADGMPCEKAYSEIYKANASICERLGVTEDKDVEIIINNFYDIMRCLCMKMFDYGAKFSGHCYLGYIYIASSSENK